MHPLLDNILWHSFTGSLAPFTTGTSRARRFSPGFPAILGFADLHNPAFADLTPHCAPGEHFYTGDWSGPVPAGWKIEEESSMFRMVLEPSTSITDDSPDIVTLQPAHGAQALALATLTKPGPFGARTLELGEYFGCFDGPQLVAMAGERFHAGPYREISAVCTHPDYQGRGLARRLMNRLICRQRQRGETTFLHVMSGNDRAHAFYERFGFRNHLHTTVRVVSRI